MSDLVCDFCLLTLDDPKKEGWTYPCDDFTVATAIVGEAGDTEQFGPYQRMRGGWLACEACSKIVELGQPTVLARHVITRQKKVKVLTRKHIEFHVAGLRIMYAEFYKSRLGPRHRPTLGEEFEGRVADLAIPHVCHLGTFEKECRALAGIELRDPDERLGEMWYPACLACARIRLGLASDAPVVPDGTRTRALTGKTVPHRDLKWPDE